MSAPIIIQPPIGQVVPVVVVPPSSGKATTALVLALLSLVAGPLTAIPGLIVGHMALSEIRRSGGAIGGSGKATAALVIGYIWVAIIALYILVGIIAALSAAAPHP